MPPNNAIGWALWTLLILMVVKALFGPSLRESDDQIHEEEAMRDSRGARDGWFTPPWKTNRPIGVRAEG
jgi:hypothetical protein